MALMAAAAGAIVLFALRPGMSAGIGNNADLAVYKDQLGALEEDLESGRIEMSEAQSARVEISRRVLAAESTANLDPETPAAGSSGAMRAIAVAIAGVLFVLTIYLFNGNPDMPGVPFAEQTAGDPREESVVQLLARIENHLLAEPEDGRGWELVAPIYLRMNRFADAARAFANAGRILGSSASRFAGLGEALVGINGGVVVQEARNYLVQAVELDPTLLRPRFMLIIALEQDAKFTEARAAWQALLDENPAEGPWRDAIAGRIEALGQRVENETGPSQADIEAAGEMSPQDRREMVTQMVERLATRLEADGNDLEGWLRLARSYAVLQQPQQARGAIERAREQFSNDDQALASIADAARDLGLEE